MLKYPLTFGPGGTHRGRGKHEIEVPPNAIFRHFQVMPENDDGQLCLWFEVRPTADLAEPRRFIVAGTGEPVDARSVWRATTGFREVVYHLFELPAAW